MDLNLGNIILGGLWAAVAILTLQNAYFAFDAIRHRQTPLWKGVGVALTIAFTIVGSMQVASYQVGVLIFLFGVVLLIVHGLMFLDEVLQDT